MPPLLSAQPIVSVSDFYGRFRHRVKEETWEWYTPNEFYPVRISQAFQSKYQVVGKLRYEAYATV
ncbi:hypothetical protein K443DRAFT_676344 [Laccaria amethystina LaAM-08-1]|uniref:Uncharacterized protein n=1 Tax=Laccaria amethystina LaAM-08-1 TaxID=1095629 RepID=A0A0C9Y7P6_9AGAR|nr:hypothetical protein K443DRAFT_676344 [Laccaria amethystina LaAM-08-1]